MELPVRGGRLPAVEIGAVYTIGLNYGDQSTRPPRPLVYGKASSAVTANGSVVSWDRSLTANVDGECELGVVVGPDGAPLGYTIVNDITSRDEWLDGDQWLLGKSMPGFCPVGPDVLPAADLDPRDLGVRCSINGELIQGGRTSGMRYSIAEILDYLKRHIRLEPGDLVATGTPSRLTGPPGPDRHLQPGDTISCWIEELGELTNTIA